MNEIERIRQKNREETRLAYENMEKALKGSGSLHGINAILRFLNVNGHIDDNLPIGIQLEKISEDYRINIRSGTLETDFYKKTVLPMLVKTKDNIYLAVIPRQSGECFYIDKGKKIKITKKNCDVFTGDVIYFYKNMGSEKITLQSLTRFMLDCVSASDKWTVIILALIASLSGLLIPWANNYIFSKIIPAGEILGTSSTMALMLSAILTVAIVKLIQSFVMANSMVRVSAYIQNSVIHRLFKIKTNFFKSEKAGSLSDLIMRFSDISQIVSANSITIFISAMLSVVYLYQVFHYTPQLLGITILITIVFLAVIIWESLSGIKHKKAYSKALSNMTGFAYEMFSGMEQVKLAGAEAKMLHRFSKKYLDCAALETPPFAQRYSQVIYKLITTLALLFVFIKARDVSASGYITFSAAYGAYIASLMSLAGVITTIGEFKASYEMVKPLFDAELEETKLNMQKPEKINGEITVSDLRFRYGDTMPYVINNMSFKIHANESVGIVGTSGCGKSTLIRLILGFETPEDGSIYIDGFDLRELDLKYYRQNIGTVMQNSGLITGDIYSNIILTKPNATMDEVRDAIEAAGLYDDIKALPMGLNTPISEENCTLSGGQKQRVLIARAILSRPKLLILDEATSALDNKTQAHIINSIMGLNCTKIIIAHRYTTIKDCDRILVLDKGKITEQGTYSELIQNEGLFAHLVSRQKTDK